jgi:hypothetical protein
MLRLNILPEDFKKEIRLFSIYGVFRNIILVFVFLTALIGIIFLFSNAVLETYISHSGSNRIIIRNNYQSLDSQIEEAESKIKHVVGIQEDSINWSKLIEDIMIRTNDEIIFSRISINREKYQLDLLGHAETRNALINLKNEFEDSINYLSIDFPIKNILEKEDINFNMLMTIDPYAFR